VKQATMSRACRCWLLQIVGVGLVWPTIVAATGVCSYFTLVNEESINALISTGFATSILLSLINTLGAMAVRLTMDIEGWHPRNVTSVRN